MLYFTYSLNILILIALPIVVGVFLVRKYDLEGRWWWIAALIYLFSQAILQPIENYVVNPYLNNLSYTGSLPSSEVLILGGLLMGLLTGGCEELLRYAMLRWWTKDARSFESVLLLGVGHGGASSIVLGLLVFYNFVNMIIIRHTDLTMYPSSNQLQYLQSQIAAFWSASWYYSLREAIGQIFMLFVQVSLAVLVMQAFVRKQWIWVLFAIVFHSLVEATRVIVLNLSNEFLANVVLGIFGIIGILIIVALHKKSTGCPG